MEATMNITTSRHRRTSLLLLLLLAAGLLFFSECSTNKSENAETYFPRLGNNADIYLRGSYDLLHMVRIRELGKIGEACKIATRRKLAGGKIVSRIGTPHIMYGGACNEDVPGNPLIAPDPKPKDRKPVDLGAGDFLILAGPHSQDARKKGCFLLGIGFPMPTNRYSPPNFNDHPDITMESQVDMMIYTWGPKEDGLVTPALTPHLKVCPTSPMTVVGYWLVMAQLAHNLAYTDTSGSYAMAEAYLDILMGRLQEFHARNIGDINKVGEIIAEKVLNGGRIYPWSYRDEFWIESTGTAGGLMGVYPLKPDSLTSKDIVIYAAADSTPVREIETIRKAREKGAWILGIFPFENEYGFDVEPLKELCDMTLDNLSGDMYGVLDISGYPSKIIPTVTMMNNYAFWAVVGAYVQAMEARGVAPYYWMSHHVPGGIEYNKTIRDAYFKRGY